MEVTSFQALPPPYKPGRVVLTSPSALATFKKTVETDRIGVVRLSSAPCTGGVTYAATVTTKTKRTTLETYQCARTTFGNISGNVKAFVRYLKSILPTPTPTPTPCTPFVSGSWQTPCPYTVGTYQVNGTGSDGLYQHTGPGTSYPKVSSPVKLANGTTVYIACQLENAASVVSNSDVWDLETNGFWVSDYYINTPSDGSYSPGLAHCIATG